jgi:hypothetical protein
MAKKDAAYAGWKGDDGKVRVSETSEQKQT